MYIRTPGKLLERTELSIDAGMVIVETILNKYIPPPHGHDNIVYVRGIRLPVTVTSNKVKSDYLKMGIGSNSPWHPCKAVPILEDLLEYYQYHHTEHAALFESNPLTRSNRIYHTSSNMTDNNIVTAYVPNIQMDDLCEILNTFLELYTIYIKPIFEKYPNNIYSLDAGRSTYQLLRYEDIRIARYNEIIEFYSTEEDYDYGVV